MLVSVPSNLPDKSSERAMRFCCFRSSFETYVSARERSVEIAGASSDARDCWAVERVVDGVSSKCCFDCG